MAGETKQQEAHAAAVREKALKDRTVPQVMSWPVDPETGKPMTVAVSMAADLVPTVAFGNVTIQTTIMRPLPVDRDLTDAELEQDITNVRKVQKAAEYVVGTERRLLQWALDPSSRVQHPTTGEGFTGEGEAVGQPPVAQTPPPVEGAPPAQGDGTVQVG